MTTAYSTTTGYTACAPSGTHSATSSSNQVVLKFPSLFDNCVWGNIHIASTQLPYLGIFGHASLSFDQCPWQSGMSSLQFMVNSGIWSPIKKSECAHGMVVIGKKDGSVGNTTDLSLNKFVIPDRHPLPFIENLLLQLHGKSIFSKIDLRKGCFNIRLDDDGRRFRDNHATAEIGFSLFLSFSIPLVPLFLNHPDRAGTNRLQ